eukprot:TRINITY_DN1930_c0_g1_i1.p1 TRINITY_DN1930_c0_g1~~TRINITY_DN1930_c0_g1_i1.p1  ORF type:complete len:451 (+),score=176.05 TRINITY_DN1930_c0_g1_i1:39-1391(+)
MSLDIGLFRADKGGNPDLVRESQRRRGHSVEIVDEVIALDTEWRRVQGDISVAKGAVNAVNKKIGLKKKAKEEVPQELLDEKEAAAAEVPRIEARSKELEALRNGKLWTIGNLVHDSVPVAPDEKANEVVKTVGEAKVPAQCYTHKDLIHMIGGIEAERGTEVAGHSGYFLRGAGVELNMALIRYGMDFLLDRAYVPLQPPFFMKKEVMSETAQLSQFDEELYKVSGNHDEELYLIATSEQPISAMHRGEWMHPKELPIKYAGWSSCFRKEAGQHGRETWGLYRVHQFDKVEQFCIVEPSTSWQVFDEMIASAEDFYQSLGLPYQIVAIASGGLNNAASKKLDLEAWFPSFNEYKELVSCSNCTDYQSRRLEVRLRTPGGDKKEKTYVHMLNSTLTATGRTICCLLENFQTEEGIVIPEVLRPYLRRYPDGIIPYKTKTPPKVKANKKKT